jgi:hypothetical protein
MSTNTTRPMPTSGLSKQADCANTRYSVRDEMQQARFRLYRPLRLQYTSLLSCHRGAHDHTRYQRRVRPSASSRSYPATSLPKMRQPHATKRCALWRKPTKQPHRSYTLFYLFCASRPVAGDRDKWRCPSGCDVHTQGAECRCQGCIFQHGRVL